MVVSPHKIDDLERIGGMLCVDFTNTIGWRGMPVQNEWLVVYGDLVRWSWTSGILTEAEAAHLVTVSEQLPELAEQVLEAARGLRENLYGIFSALANERQTPAPALDALNHMLPYAMGKLRLALADGGVQWQWRHEPDALDAMLNPIIHSAAELLTSPHVTRLKECANDGCGWLFLDTSRNRSRRWCDMRECGNRAKARRHYRRLKSSQ